jgi:hypothetical protein
MGMYTTRKLVAGAAAGMLVTSGSGCGDPDHTVEVLSPGPGDVVTVPIEVALDSDVPLGPSSVDEYYHVHIWFDDDVDAYSVIEGEVGQITSAPDGQHEMHVSLHHADHTPAGAETALTVEIRGGGTTITD